MTDALAQFSLQGRTAVVLGGGGVLGAALAEGFCLAGAGVAVADLRREAAQGIAEKLQKEGVEASAHSVDVLDREALEKCLQGVLERHERIDILLNAAGGNVAGATTSENLSFFDLPREGLEKVLDLNLLGGAMLPAQVFGRAMAGNPQGGVLLFISSMSALQPLTRVCGYSAAKAAVSNFTGWLAVHLAQEYGAKLRVNALAPGFFLTDQNRYLLTEEKSGQLTERGKTIIAHTPMGRFGQPEDLVGTALWLASDASRFVTGIVVPVDGGFSAFSGV